MANITATKDSAARVEQMAQGPVPEPGVIFYPPPGTGEPGPPVEPPHPYLGIDMVNPVSGQISGPASQGVVIVANGYVDFNKYTVDRVEVKFPGSGFVQAALDPNASWSWTATSLPVKTAGLQKVTARVIGRKHDGPSTVNPPPQVSHTVEIVLTDDIAPVVTVSQPANKAVLRPNPSGQYLLPLEVKVSDPSGVSVVEYNIENSGWQAMPLQPSAGVWRAGPGALMQYLPREQVVAVRARDTRGNVGYGSVRVLTKDESAPIVRINGDSAISLPGQGAAGAVLPVLSGTARDQQSGVKRVEWSLDGGGFTAVDPQNLTGALSGGTAYWRVANIKVPPGVHRIQVRAADNADKLPSTPANVSTPVEIKIAVTEKYRPKDPTVREYFSSLVDFVARRLKRGVGSPASANVLASVLYQPFQQLLATDPALPPSQVSQLPALDRVPEQ